MDVQVIIQVMLKLFFILILGFILNKVGILDTHANIKISSLIAKVTAPFLIIASSLSASTDNREQVLIILAAGFVMYIGFILFGKLIVSVCHFPKQDRPVYECMLVFSNNAFMGYPVLQSILGMGAVFYSSMLHFSFNIFAYTYAVLCFAKTDSDNKQKLQWNKLFNPGFVLTIIAFIIFVSGFRINGFVYDTIYMVGNITAPLSMILLGSTLALYPLKESLLDWHCYAFSSLRLLVLPILSFAICKLLGVNDYMTSIVTITNGMPVAALIMMIANEYHSDTKLLIRNIVVSTALSVITIPVVVTLLLT